MQLHNRWGQPLRVLYLDMVPWFVRIYLHTLRIEAVGEEGNPLASPDNSESTICYLVPLLKIYGCSHPENGSGAQCPFLFLLT